MYTKVDKHIISLGSSFITNLHEFARSIQMALLSFVDGAKSGQPVRQVIASQIYFTGVQAAPLVSVMALLTGVLVILITQAQMSLMGDVNLIGTFLIAVAFRELAPLITLLIVVARSGTAIATEVGNMKANKEIEALEVLGVNALTYIVFPRLVGGILSVVALGFLFGVISVFGGTLLTVFLQDFSISMYMNSILSALTVGDFLFLFLKLVVSGFFLFTICTYEGLSVQKSSTEVPVRTTKAVMRSLSVCMVFHLVFSGVFYWQMFLQKGLL